jgi:uncharacterized protein
MASPVIPRDPKDFGWLLDNFATATPGVRHALIVSSDGLPLITAGDMSADLADPLAAMTSGIISLATTSPPRSARPAVTS